MISLIYCQLLLIGFTVTYYEDVFFPYSLRLWCFSIQVRNRVLMVKLWPSGFWTDFLPTLTVNVSTGIKFSRLMFSTDVFSSMSPINSRSFIQPPSEVLGFVLELFVQHCVYYLLGGSRNITTALSPSGEPERRYAPRQSCAKYFKLIDPCRSSSHVSALEICLRWPIIFTMSHIWLFL